MSEGSIHPFSAKRKKTKKRHKLHLQSNLSISYERYVNIIQSQLKTQLTQFGQNNHLQMIRQICCQFYSISIKLMIFKSILLIYNKGGMDLDHLENALDNLELKQDQIRNVAQYCITNNANSELEITKLIEKHFLRHKDARPKTALFLLTSEIFFEANLRKNKLFFKHLSPKIKLFIESLLHDAIDNLQLGALISGAIEKWQSQQIFAETFIERIKDTASPIFSKLAEQRAGGGKHQKFTKYKKTFLMELMDIRKFQPTSKIYDTFVQMSDINARINSFQQAYSKLDFDNSNEETQKRARELQRIADDYRERLETVICGFHKGFKILADECREDFSKLDKSE